MYLTRGQAPDRPESVSLAATVEWTAYPRREPRLCLRLQLTHLRELAGTSPGASAVSDEERAELAVLLQCPRPGGVSAAAVNRPWTGLVTLLGVTTVSLPDRMTRRHGRGLSDRLQDKCQPCRKYHHLIPRQ